MSLQVSVQAENPLGKIVEDTSNLAKPQVKNTSTTPEATPATQQSGNQIGQTPSAPTTEHKDAHVSEKKDAPTPTAQQTVVAQETKTVSPQEAKPVTNQDNKPQEAKPQDVKQDVYPAENKAPEAKPQEIKPQDAKPQDQKTQPQVVQQPVVQQTVVQQPVVQQDFKAFLAGKGFRELSLVMKEPEKLEVSKVKNWHEAEQHGHKGIDTMKHYSTHFYDKENEFVHRERRFLDKSEEFLEDFANEIIAKIAENQKLIATLELDVKNLEPKRAESQSGLDKIEAAIASLQTKITDDRNEILNIIKNKEALAGKINPEELRHIKIKDEKSPINIIFQWVLVVIYGENLSKYDWDNFKSQAFKKDKGVDFSDRLRGFNVQKSKVDPAISKRVQEEKTAILAEVEKKGTNQSLRTLFDYAALIKKVSDDLEDIKVTEANLAEKKQELEKKKNVHSEILNHILGIDSQLKILKTYNATFQKINDLLKNTTDLVAKRSANQQRYLEKYGGKEPADQIKEAAAEEEAENKKYQAQIQAQQAQTQHTTGQPTNPNEPKATVQEEGMGGGKTTSPKKAKKEVKSAVTDLGETPFAEKKEGGCEGCNIF